MSYIKVDCGTVQLENLLTVSFENIQILGWCVKLNYKNQKDPIRIKCKSEEQARKCCDEISNKLTDSDSSIISFTR